MNGPIVKRGVAQGLNREPESTESTVKEKGENSINKGDTINVHTEQGYNAVNSSGDILKRDDGDGCISHNPPGTDDMAQETVKENAQNLKPDSNQHNDVSDTEYRHVSNVNTEVTNSDGNDGYARLSHASNESMEDENVLCQDEFHTEEFIFAVAESAAVALVVVEVVSVVKIPRGKAVTDGKAVYASYRLQAIFLRSSLLR
ncbi:hypothetical protein CHS0354_035508 [Potamilus streckersoni]|uniref:Uncharacterized protein n=1 Tax=Potamilus streckersoni TaxID=2493646 RepID=A0AAE0RWA0_9BIVA|nr:hypothetical protein CHS0354_035508 [Potamilus streckersoni]